MKITFFITSIVCLFAGNINAQDSARVKTNSNDKRIESLTKTWYLSPSGQKDFTSAYTSKKHDSCKLIFTLKPDGSYSFENRSNKAKGNRVGQWILNNDFLYLETVSNKNEYSAYKIQILHDTVLVITFKEIKDITEPFLCSGMQIYQITEIPAQFGQNKLAFENYITSTFSIKQLKNKTDQQYVLIEFIINCEGEIYVPFSIQKKSELENYLLSLIKQMPKWTPSIMAGRKVNELKKYQFSLENQRLFIRKI